MALPRILITDLSKISGLFVVARHTSFTYKNKPVKVQQVGRELGVGFILEGSVRKAGTRVRVTGQLISSKDGGHVWADRFDRDLTDILPSRTKSLARSSRSSRSSCCPKKIKPSDGRRRTTSRLILFT